MTTTTNDVLDDTAKVFLHHLSAIGLATAAAAAAGISTQACYKRRAKDEHFAKLWDTALEQARERIATALQHAAHDQTDAARLLGEVADRLKDPNLSADDRATHLRHLHALGERVEQLKELASSEAAKAHQRRRDASRAQLRKDLNDAVAVAAEFDVAVRELEPAFKRLREALATVQRTGVRAEVECPEVTFDVLMRCGLHFHAPEFAAFLNVLRPDRRHQQEFAKFVAQRRPAEVS